MQPTKRQKTQASILNFFRSESSTHIESDMDAQQGSSQANMSDSVLSSIIDAPKVAVHSTPSKLKQEAACSTPLKTAVKDDQDEERYDWLVNVKDKHGNSQGAPGFNPSTLYIPKHAWNAFTPFEKQYWEIKSDLFDTVLFFKKGKFYELYENDADIAGKLFDLKVTNRVNMRMAGVPEMSFEMWASRFLDHGYRIAKVDQSETSISKRTRESLGSSGPKDKIIKRQLSCVLTKGTITDPSMVLNENAAYLIVVKDSNDHALSVNVVIYEASLNTVYVVPGDVHIDSLCTVLKQVQPVEIVYYGSAFEIKRVFKQVCPSVPLNVHACPTQLNDPIDALKAYFKMLHQDDALENATIQAFDVLGGTKTLILDGNALYDLDIINSQKEKHTTKQTIFKELNNCSSEFGCRRLKWRVLNPLISREKIVERQEAVDFLLQNPSFTDLFDTHIKKTSDIERQLTAICRSVCRVKDFVAFLASFSIINNLRKKLIHGFVEPKSLLIRQLLFFSWPCFEESHSEILALFDYSRAKDDGTPHTHGHLGIIIPRLGFDEEYDALVLKLDEVKKKAEVYRAEMEKTLKTKIAFKDIGKEPFQLEISAGVSVPPDFMVMSSTKFVKRYWSPSIRKIVQEFEVVDDALMSTATTNYALGFTKTVFEKIQSHMITYRDTIVRIIDAISELDFLSALAKYCMRIKGIARIITLGPACFPTILDAASTNFFKAKEMRIPFNTSNTMMANDLHLESATGPAFILLTGPNMGGKSTVLRQVALIAVLGQLGCQVTASECEFTIFDRIFTRIGSSDNLVEGKSTFMKEMEETNTILQQSSQNSLVIIDELGRGTCSSDGIAIAASALIELAFNKRCLGLFATHLHELTYLFESQKLIKSLHMGFSIADDSILFLYKLKEGPCPKSFGVEVARQCGIPRSVVDKAREISGSISVANNLCRMRPFTYDYSDFIFSLNDILPLLEAISIINE